MKEEIDKQDQCTWNNYIENLCMYETSCGNSFYFSEGTVTDNDFKFCPFCGKQIDEVEYKTRVNIMKEFNLDKALAGKPVVTRDGRNVYELVVLKSALRSLIIVVDGETYSLYKDGCVYDTLATSPLDLFMAEESYYGFKDGEDCYILNTGGAYSKCTVSIDNDYLMDCLAQGNAFKTKEEAEKERDCRAAKFRLNAKMRELEGDWKADYSNINQKKYLFAFDCKRNKIIYSFINWSKAEENWRYSNEETIKWVVENMADDIKIILGVE